MEQERQRLRDALEHVMDEALKTHMLAALAAYDAAERDQQQQGASAAQVSARDDGDAIKTALRSQQVTTKAPRDALFLAVHALAREAGYRAQNAASGDDDALALPAGWDVHSATGLFAATYMHVNDRTIVFTLQGLFVGNKFALHLSDDREHTHSVELSTSKYLALGDSAGTTSAADVLRDLAALRQQVLPLFEKAAPKPKREATAESPKMPRTSPSPQGGSTTGTDPYVIPPVGRGDILPPGLGGGDASTHVGPDHPLFGRRYDPAQGPVPGARFDPFGPVSIDPNGPPRGFLGGPQPRHPGPAPNLPFGDPAPDHLRMPRDDEFEDPFAPPGGPRRPGQRFGPPDMGMGGGFGGGPGFGGDFMRPFGSDHSFF